MGTQLTLITGVEPSQWDCDWEDDLCLWCGMALDDHTNQQLTRCARHLV